MSLPNNIVPLVTPRNHGTVDLKSLEKLLQFQVHHHTTAVFLLGTTGEFNKMSLADKKILIDGFYKIVAHEKKQIISLVGIAANDPIEMQDLIKYCDAKNYNVTAFVLAPMFGNGDPATKIHLALQSTTKPIMLYNNPAAHAGKSLSLTLVKEFTNHPQIIGIKDSSGDKVYFHALLALANNKFHVYQGVQDNLINDLKDPRVSGMVSGTANIIPEVFYNMAMNIDRESAQQNINTTKEQLAKYHNYIKGLKIMLHAQGILASVE